MVEITLFSPKPIVDKLDESYQRIRYGRVLEFIRWTPTSVVTAPGAGSVLVSASPPTGKRLWIYGYYIDSPEANLFDIRWTSGGLVKHVRVRFPGPGTVIYTDFISIQEGEPPDIDTKVEIVVVSTGSAGTEYRGRLLVGVTG